MNKNSKLKFGFTLIELLIVISIISILISIAVPKVANRNHEAKRMQAIIQIQFFMQALEKYKLDNGRYPNTEEGLYLLIKPINYLDKKSIPLDPWKNNYLYISPGINTRAYEIISLGKDKESGGEGYDKDIKSYEIEETM